MPSDARSVPLNALLRRDRPLLDYFELSLNDGGGLLTLLWAACGEDSREITVSNIRSRMEHWTTDIWYLMPGRAPELWPPGVQYPNGSMFAADPDGVLYGWAFREPRTIYACCIEGGHIATFSAPLRVASPLSPLMCDGCIAVEAESPTENVRWMAPKELRCRYESAARISVVGADIWRYWSGPDMQRIAAFLQAADGMMPPAAG